MDPEITSEVDNLSTEDIKNNFFALFDALCTPDMDEEGLTQQATMSQEERAANALII